MTISVEKIGRRHYLIGNTYAIKDQLRGAKCRWDRDRRAWWTGKADVAEQFSGSTTDSNQNERVDLDARVIRARASYKGKSYYVLAHGISTKTGKEYAKLCFRDGSRVFWASDLSKFQITKNYGEPTSIASLHAYADRRKKEDAGEIECAACARYCTCGQGFCPHHHDGCDRCGMEC